MSKTKLTVLAIYGVALLGLTAYGYHLRAAEIDAANDNEILATMMDAQNAPAPAILPPPVL